ncbi:MAG: hypothetical protein HY869_04655 [Chloroflexi bacterium]|nr:hypothetical protein [Chloroflexota bacterium]
MSKKETNNITSGIVLAFREGGKILIQVPGRGSLLVSGSHKLRADGTPIQIGDNVNLILEDLSDGSLRITFLGENSDVTALEKTLDYLAGDSTTDAPPPDAKKKKKRKG